MCVIKIETSFLYSSFRWLHIKFFSSIFFFNHRSLVSFLFSEFWIKLTLSRTNPFVTSGCVPPFFFATRMISATIVKNNLGEEETVLCARCGGVFAVYRAIRLRERLALASHGVCRREEADAEGREKAARERSRRGAGWRNEMENGGRQGYQCGRWLLAAKWLQAANALTTSYNIEYKRNQKYRTRVSESLLSAQIPPAPIPIPSALLHTRDDYVLLKFKCPYVRNSLALACRQKFVGSHTY